MSKVNRVVNKILEGVPVRKAITEFNDADADADVCKFIVDYADATGTITKIRVGRKSYYIGGNDNVECLCKPGESVTVYCRRVAPYKSLILSLSDDDYNYFFEKEVGSHITFKVPMAAVGEASFSVFNGVTSAADLGKFDPDGDIQTLSVQVDGWLSSVKDFKVF